MEYSLWTQQAHLAISQKLTERLSVDSKTGVLTYNTQKVLFERMVETGLLSEMQHMGYALEMLVLDLDKLKNHNTIGDHAGGDAALSEAIDCLKPLYRRSTDFLVTAGILGHENAARQAIKSTGEFRQLSRFETGDEIIALNFLPPTKGPEDRRDHLSSIGQRAEQIATVLREVWVTYPYASQKNAAELREELGDDCIEFSVSDEGIVRARVSGTFAVVRAPLPTTIDNFDGIFRHGDRIVGELKQNRERVRTQGVPVSLFPVE